MNGLPHPLCCNTEGLEPVSSGRWGMSPCPFDERYLQKPGVENPRTERLVVGGEEEDSIVETEAQSYGKRPLATGKWYGWVADVYIVRKEL